MFSRLSLVGLMVPALCVACDSSSSGSTFGGGGTSGSSAGASGAAGTPGPRAGDECQCQGTFVGSVDCDAEGCACLCARVECTTAGGLTSDRSCRDQDCEECEPRLARPNGDFALQQPAFRMAMASDESTYVEFGGFPYLGHYGKSGELIPSRG